MTDDDDVYIYRTAKLFCQDPTGSLTKQAISGRTINNLFLTVRTH